MADFNNAIIGLQNTVITLSDADKRLRTFTEQVTGVPFPSQVKQNTSVSNRKSIIWQVADLPKQYTLPDLIMTINPQSMRSDYNQLTNHKSTFGGYIEEHWGEQLDTISSSGVTASFFGANGLTNFARRDTDSMKEFEKFVTIYRNNGTLFDSQTGRIIAQGSVVMNYDSSIYYGYFESLSVNETGDKQFNLSYDFSFKVTREVYPGRIRSFKNITTVARPGAPKNDHVTLDILSNSVA